MTPKVLFELVVIGIGAVALANVTAVAATSPMEKTATGTPLGNSQAVQTPKAEEIKIARLGRRGMGRSYFMRGRGLRGGRGIRHGRRGLRIHRARPRIWRRGVRILVPGVVVVPRVYGASRCDYWHRRCVESWGRNNANYRGCMRYHDCY